MEDENGGLSIPEVSIPIIGRKNKIVNNYEGQKMGGYWQKGTGNNTIVPNFVSGFEYFERKYNRECDEHIG